MFLMENTTTTTTTYELISLGQNIELECDQALGYNCQFKENEKGREIH